MSSARIYDEEEGNRGFPWFVVTGVVFGILIGLFISWFFFPVEYTNASPADLNADDKDTYRAMISLAYDADGDRGRAEARLNLLGDKDSAAELDLEAQRYLGGKGPAEDARAMAQLATNLRQPPGPADPLPVATGQAFADIPTSTPTAAPTTKAGKTTTPASVVRTPTATLFPTLPSAPTLTPSPTPGAPFRLVGQSPICNPEGTPGLLQVQVENAATAPVAGVRVIVTWKGGDDFFFTGLAPDMNPGYGDFFMSAGQEYTLQVGESGEPISGIFPPNCPKSDGSSFLGGIKLRFRQ